MSTKLNSLLQAIPRDTLDPSALDHLKGHIDEPWFLACSGGADSVCLVHLLTRLYPDKVHTLHVIHFNHHLRGEESDADATFVQGLAKEYGLTFHLGEGKGLEGQNEASLREARLSYIHKEMDHYHANILLQGHHKDDVAETLLMRLSRGTSLTGLAAPRPVQPFQSQKFHVRPFLSIGREAIHKAMDSAGLPWREDTSNQEHHYFRNRMRHKLLPLLEEIAPNDTTAAMAHTRQLLQEEDEALDKWASNAYAQLHRNYPDILSWPGNLPVAIIRRVLHYWLPGGSISAPTMEPVLQAIMEETKLDIQLTQEHHLLVDPEEKVLRIRRVTDHPQSVWPPVHLAPSQHLYLPEGHSLVWEYLPVTDEVFEDLSQGRIDPANTCWLDPAKLPSPPNFLQIRHRQPGDHYQPLGMDQPAKLQHVLSNRKIPANLRDQHPAIVSPGGEILWYPGCPAPEPQKIEAPTSNAIRITYTPKKPLF